MRRISYLLCFLLGLLFVMPLQAVTLGEVSVPLADRSSASVRAAEQAALTQLLIQLTGRSDVASLPGVANLLSNPQQWLSQYGFTTSPAGASLLTASFDAKAVSKALFAAGAPIWSTSRPPLLLWLAMPEGLASAQSGSLLMQTAAQRGLPLLLPPDGNALDTADIRGRFMQPVFSASAGYATDLVATAVIYAGSPASVRWWLYQKNVLLTQGQGSAADTQAAQGLLINQLTDAIASHYAVQGGATGTYALQVRNLDTLESWHALNQYFSSLAGVTDVMVTQVSGSQVSWNLAFSGGADQLGRLLALNRHLVDCAAPLPAATTAQTAAPSNAPTTTAQTATPSNAPLVYCWQP